MMRGRLDYKPVVDSLQQAASVMRNTRPLMRSVAGIMMRAVEDNFEQEGRPKWVDLKPSTKLTRSKEGTWPGKILQRSGGLATSMQQFFDSNTAMVGTNKVYARILNDGGRTKAHVIRPKSKRALSFGGIVVRQVNHPGSNIPSREFMRLAPGDLREVVVTANDFYQRALPK